MATLHRWKPRLSDEHWHRMPLHTCIWGNEAVREQRCHGAAGEGQAARRSSLKLYGCALVPRQ